MSIGKPHAERQEAMKLSPLAAVVVLVGVTLAGCSEDTPAVCASVNSLVTSVNDVKGIDITASGAIDDLQSGLTTIKTDLADVKSDAKAEFAPQIDAVDASYTALTTSVDAAIADPTAATLAAAGTAVDAFTTAVKTLVSDVKATC